MKSNRRIFIKIKVEVNADTDLSDSDIVSELNYNISTFDKNVDVTNTEIVDICE